MDYVIFCNNLRSYSNPRRTNYWTRFSPSRRHDVQPDPVKCIPGHVREFLQSEGEIFRFGLSLPSHSNLAKPGLLLALTWAVSPGGARAAQPESEAGRVGT